MALKTFAKSTHQSAPVFSHLLEDTSVLSGQDATLECCVQGYPIPDVRWEKGGIQLANTRRLHTERQGDKCRLLIKSCTRLETGQYKCIAVNKFGTTTTAATVRFDVVPARAPGSSYISSSVTNGGNSTPPKPSEVSIVPKLKKVQSPTIEKPNNEQNVPSFKDLQLKKTPLRNSFKRNTESSIQRVPSLRKTKADESSKPQVEESSPAQRVSNLRKTASNASNWASKREDGKQSLLQRVSSLRKTNFEKHEVFTDTKPVLPGPPTLRKTVANDNSTGKQDETKPSLSGPPTLRKTVTNGKPVQNPEDTKPNLPGPPTLRKTVTNGKPFQNPEDTKPVFPGLHSLRKTPMNGSPVQKQNDNPESGIKFNLKPTNLRKTHFNGSSDNSQEDTQNSEVKPVGRLFTLTKTNLGLKEKLDDAQHGEVKPVVKFHSLAKTNLNDSQNREAKPVGKLHSLPKTNINSGLKEIKDDVQNGEVKPIGRLHSLPKWNGSAGLTEKRDDSQNTEVKPVGRLNSLPKRTVNGGLTEKKEDTENGEVKPIAKLHSLTKANVNGGLKEKQDDEFERYSQLISKPDSPKTTKPETVEKEIKHVGKKTSNDQVGTVKQDNEETVNKNSGKPKLNGNKKTYKEDANLNEDTPKKTISNGNSKAAKKELETQRVTSTGKTPPKPPSKTTKEESTTGFKRNNSMRQRKQIPKFVLPPKSKVVKEGESVRFMCSSSGIPEPKVTWKKKDVELCPSDRLLCYQTDCMHILELKDVNTEDAGEYTVVLDNEIGKAEESALLEVKAKKSTSLAPRVIRPLYDMSVKDGQSCHLSCEVSGTPSPTCQWSRGRKPLEAHSDFLISFDGQTASLTIKEVFPEDEGTYALTAENRVGQDVTSCVLTVKQIQGSIIDEDGLAPIFTTKLNDLDVNDGEHLTLSVEVSVPTDSFDESNSTKEHGFQQPRRVSCDPMESMISIAKRQSEAELEDAKSAFRRSVVKSKGALQYDERHRSGSVTADALLTSYPELSSRRSSNSGSGSSSRCSSRRPSYMSARLSPAQILKGPRSLAVLRGETITLRCQFVGYPEPTVSWIKGGKILTPSDRVSLEVEEALAVLTLKGAMADDSGKYIVAVENSGGSDCLFASVSVEGPPDPLGERPVVSDATNHSVVLAWSGSPFDGGSVITGYAVEMCTLPELRWRRVSGACHSTSYTVRDLLPNRNYIFRIRAENVHGFSDPSPESDQVYIRDNDEEEDNEVHLFEESNNKDIVIENGQSFTEQYDLLEGVGKGRFGIVHKCLEKVTGEVRAAKIIRCVKQKDKQKMREEVEIMNLLKHPKLLQLVSAFENPKDLILVMEYISGGELFERVIADDFVLLEKDCVLFLHQICDGVRYMHDNNIVHLDLKPENILCETKTSHQIKIIDFGLARKYNASESFRVLFGTPEFVAPEVIAYEPVSPASDMWSVGVICYVLLTGLSPFMGDSDAETFANITRADYDFDDETFDAVSSDAKDFIDKLFLKRPEKRLTASGCLLHKWLAKDQNRNSVVQLNTDKLKKFIIRRKWQKTGNAIRALGRMVSLSSPSRSISSRGSFSDSESSFSIPSLTSVNSSDVKSEILNEQDEDSCSGVFLSSTEEDHKVDVCA